jgi:hypothetical protein
MDYDLDTVSFRSSAPHNRQLGSHLIFFEYASHTGRTTADILSILRLLKDAAMQELLGRVSFIYPSG